MSEHRTVILVEGESDALAVEAYARRIGRDLADEGVDVLALGGGGAFGAQIRELGPAGRDLTLLGLCDADHERRWARWLEAASLGRDLDRAAMETLGFFVCDADLEDELVRGIGVPQVLELVGAVGEGPAYRTLARQPAQRGKTDAQLLRRFFGTKAGRKARYAPLLVEALPVGADPRPLVELLARAAASASRRRSSTCSPRNSSTQTRYAQSAATRGKTNNSTR
jgi:hypothetical protein